ncbi:GntR family transcriptional regulator [Kaistia adipata]|uniref:GntR family transcriptional regulator n=1 Tax=Kaistia adipata TaxID=166954 RepID=UPI00041EE667|nr:GntR family transcriptional regulator [Kaistia adipata]
MRLQLEEEILTGRLRPGEKLDETQIAARFGLSRTPVREAFQALASANLVELRPHQGAYVAALSLKALIEMFEVMAILESSCAALAARRHTLEDRQRIADWQARCEDPVNNDDPRAFYDANGGLHDAIYRASHNEFLIAQTTSLRQRLDAYRHRVTYHPGLIGKSNREHREIVDAIFSMDEAEAGRAMRQHLVTLRDDITAMFETGA